MRWHTVASELLADVRRSSIRLQLLQQLRQAWIHGQKVRELPVTTPQT